MEGSDLREENFDSIEIEEFERKTVTVTKPEKMNDSLVGYVLYTVTVTSTDGTTTIQRRYRDFDWLHRKLRQEFTHSLIPPIPAKSVKNRFQVEFLESRSKSLQRFLQCLLNHRELRNSGYLKLFLETTGSKEFQSTKDMLSSSSKSVIITTIGKNVDSIIPVPEIDPWYDTFNLYISNFEKYLLKKQKFLKDMSQYNHDQLQLMYLFSDQLANYSRMESPSDPNLSKHTKKLADLLLEIILARKEQFNAYELLLEQIEYYIQLLPSAKELLYNRLSILQSYFQIRQKTHQLLEKLVLEDKNSKPQTELDLRMWEDKTSEAATQFRHFSRKVKSELFTHFYKKMELHDIIKKFTSQNLEHETKIANLYQSFMDDVQKEVLFV